MYERYGQLGVSLQDSAIGVAVVGWALTAYRPRAAAAYWATVGVIATGIMTERWVRNQIKAIQWRARRAERAALERSSNA